MTERLTDTEWGFLHAMPEQDLVELAVELDLLVPERIEARALLEECLPLLLDRARVEGLPFSRYDLEDLAELPDAHRRAIARLQGLADDASPDRIVRAGEKVYRTYQKLRPRSAVALLLPSLLPALARLASERAVQR